MTKCNLLPFYAYVHRGHSIVNSTTINFFTTNTNKKSCLSNIKSSKPDPETYACVADASHEWDFKFVDNFVNYDGYNDVLTLREDEY